MFRKVHQVKQSDYHQAHGLSGSIRLTQSGQTVDFHFPKGENRLHLQCDVGGHKSDAWLVAEPLPAEDGQEQDMRLTLVIQGEGRKVDAKRRAEASAVHVSSKITEVLPSPNATAGDIHEDGPTEERDLVRNEPSRETNTVDAWAKPNDVNQDGFEGNPKTHADDWSGEEGKDGHTIAGDAAVEEALREEKSLETPPLSVGATNPGNVDRVVNDSGKVEMKTPAQRGPRGGQRR